MKRGIAGARSSLVGAVLSAGLLLLLASLQYRWIGEISAADRDRLRAGLEASVEAFRDEFNRRLMDLAAAFRPAPFESSAEDWSWVAERYNRWSSSARYEDVLAHIVVRGSDGARFLRLNFDSGEMEPFEPDESVARSFAELDRRARPGRPGPAGPRVPGWLLSSDDWTLIETVVSARRPAGRRRPVLESVGELALILDPERFAAIWLPSMARPRFGGGETLDYRVRILAGERTLYSTDDGDPAESGPNAAEPDIRAPLLWTREEAAQSLAERFRRGPGDPRGPPIAWITPSRGEGPWELTAGLAQGSVDAVAARLRRRNLAVSGGVLALLAFGMGLVLVSARRAQRLAALQMEFVAGVSHELRTPLAVIRSAADNLAAGVASGPERVREYGALIRDQGRRLTTMIEQSLRFASSQSGRKRETRLESADVGALIERAIEEAEPAIAAAGFTLEREIPDELPPVAVDREGALLCLRNLIQNALKYGAGERRVKISAEADERAVRITVADRGPGVEAAERRRIFEPFYRGRRAVADQIEGAGLGLSLAKTAAEDFGGRLELGTAPGGGAAFTLRAPRAERGTGG